MQAIHKFLIYTIFTLMLIGGLLFSTTHVYAGGSEFESCEELAGAGTTSSTICLYPEGGWEREGNLYCSLTLYFDNTYWQINEIFPFDYSGANLTSTRLNLCDTETFNLNYSGVSFTYDSVLTNSVSAETLPQVNGQRGGPTGLWGSVPRHLYFTFNTSSDRQAEIAVYPVNEYLAINAKATDASSRMQSILSGQGIDPNNLPILPLEDTTYQYVPHLFFSNIVQVDFQNGTGVRFITSDFYAPLDNNNIYYTFQGMTYDENFYIVVNVPISHPVFPEQASTPRSFEEYQADAELKSDILNNLTVSTFTPHLFNIDMLVQSLLVQPEFLIGNPQATNPTRVEFSSGTSSTQLTGNIGVDETSDDYLLYAFGGQTMSVSVTSPSNQVYLSISGVVDGAEYLSATATRTEWTGVLPSTQDYVVRVVSFGVADAYTLNISIPPTPSNEDTIAQQSTSNRAAFINSLKASIANHDYTTLETLMSDPFGFSFWGSHGAGSALPDAIERLRTDFIPTTATIEFPDNSDFSVLLPGIDINQFFAQPDTIIHSRGWGVNGEFEAILIISQNTAGNFVWENVLIAGRDFASLGVPIPPVANTQVPPPSNCDFTWFFSPIPEYCPSSTPSSYDVVIQNFENGFMLWDSRNGGISVFYTANGQARSWSQYWNTWQVGMPENAISETPPSGLYAPIRGFGLVWRDLANRQTLGWATGEEFAFHAQLQCDDHMRTFACYISTPKGVVQFRGQGLWAYWNNS